MPVRTLCRRIASAFAAVVAVAALSAPAARADVDSFTVNDTGDAGDDGLNGTCDTVTGIPIVCTLRAAIQESNDGDTTDTDTIGWAASSQTTTLTAVLPDIDEALTINGCSAFPNTPGPCNGVSGLNTSTDAFVVSNVPAGQIVTIRGLAITNSDRAILGLTGSAGLVVKGNYLGLTVNGSDGGNQTGVELVDDGGVVGGTGGATGTSPADRNVIANSGDAGVEVSAGGDDTVIQGNYFGTNDLGNALRANAENIELDGNGADPVEDTIIGGTQPNPGICSGPCNVISGATSTGIDTNGGTQDAEGTTIRGNFIGLNAAGTAAIMGATAMGIRHVNGADTTIGGPAAGDRNYITGGSSGIFSSFQGAPNLRIENNYIGTNVAGTASLAPPSQFGINVLSDDASGGGAEIVDNVVSTDDTAGTDGIQLTGGANNDPALLDGNSVGVGTGGQSLQMGAIGVRTIRLNDSTISNNTIGNTSLSTLTLEGNEDNTVTGNRLGIDANGGAEPNTNRGIYLLDNGGLGSTGNTIGGTTAASENVISNTADDAIEIDDDGSDDNTIGRNRGSNNGSDASDLFIDLWDGTTGDGAGNPATGANNGIDAPTVTSATDDVVAGSGAAPNATVLIFRTPDTGGPQDVTSFFAQATASAAGAWQAPTNVPNGTRLTALQTDASGDSSELSASVATVADPPETTITGGPKKRSRLKRGKRRKRVTFSFTSSEPGEGGFQCQMDNRAFVLCNGGSFTTKVRRGRHTFRVRAFDGVGNPDPTLATRSFRILRAPRR